MTCLDHVVGNAVAVNCFLYRCEDTLRTTSIICLIVLCNGCCLFCGFCEDACPVEAVALGRLYEYCTYETEGLNKNKEDLLKPELLGKAEKGGEVRKASLVVDGDKVSVPVSGDKGYHWWSKIRRE